MTGVHELLGMFIGEETRVRVVYCMIDADCPVRVVNRSSIPLRVSSTAEARSLRSPGTSGGSEASGQGQV
jgi:hypothetical protein